MIKPGVALTRHSREREAQIQGRLLDVLEARFARKVGFVAAQQAQSMLDSYRLLGYTPPPTDADVTAMRDVYHEMATASVRTFGSRVVTQGKDMGALEAKELAGFIDFFNALANSWVNMEAIRRRITKVTETTRNSIIGIIEGGQRDGLSIDAIAKRIDDSIPSIRRWRGALIARTETHGAANYGAHETAKTTGLDLVKEWVSTGDHRTRRLAMEDQYDHMAMDGQKRDMDEPFLMPWSRGQALPIMYPGEAGKPGGAVINCRCVSVHRVKR